ncbi:MAG: hypothetical protein CL868_08790 [Cytophagaceae bacterium]|nr:hypothetical protein [Cytophagaceae bacterium]|tara:strand:+ start:6202 stop:6942 length:741 start_codon:yes stop_codon:yes gene_type:complete
MLRSNKQIWLILIFAAIVAMGLMLGLSIWFAVFSFLVLPLIFFVISFQIQWNFFLEAFNYKRTSQKVLALTFDDGPHPEITPQILDLLKKHNAKATFFCIGQHAEKHPEILKRILEEGHGVGNHSYSHKNTFPFFGESQIKTELEQTDAILKQANTLFRPPFGVTNPTIAKVVKETGHQVIGWNVRSFDTVIKNPQTITKRILNKVKPGSIILMHDTRPQTLEALKVILPRLSGHKLVTISQLQQA